MGKLDVILYGADGRQGRCVAHLLRKHGYVNKIIGVEDEFGPPNGDNVDKMYTGRENVSIKDQMAGIAAANDLKHPKIVSCMPYFCNVAVAQAAVDLQLCYFDLGGHVDTTKKIKDYAQKKHLGPVMTDLGLAPGVANMIGEYAYKNFPDVGKIITFCGGLPETPDGADPYRYMLTWSPEGLHNEYVDDCEIVKNGERVIVPGLSGIQTLYFNNNSTGQTHKFDMFRTSGGSASSIPLMKARSVDFEYKTLRYPGYHKHLVHQLKYLEWDATSLADSLYKYPEGARDIVYVGAEVIGQDYEANINYTIHPKDGFSAMQIATSAGIIAALNNTRFESNGFFDPVGNYSHIDNLQYMEEFKAMTGA